MKAIFLKILALPLLFTFFMFSGCDAENSGGIKTITHPYIAEYQCVEAKLGEIDLLKDFEYFTINFNDTKEIEVNAKPKYGQLKSVKGSYTVDENTNELNCDFGILGYNFKQKIIIDKGEFCVSKPIGDKLFFIKFKAK